MSLFLWWTIIVAIFSGTLYFIFMPVLYKVIKTIFLIFLHVVWMWIHTIDVCMSFYLPLLNVRFAFLWVLSRSCKISNCNAQKNFLGEALQKLGICQTPLQSRKPAFAHFSSVCVCECAGVHPFLVHTCMCMTSVHAKSQCCTSVAVLYRHSDMPVMDEIVRDFKVAESSSESASVFRQAGLGLPDKPLKTLNPVNSQCKSVCCTVLIHN